MDIKFLNLKKSDKDKFKYVISLVVDDKVKKIYFGASGYNDYTIYSKTLSKEEANKKKDNYIKRHQVNEDWNDPLKKGTLSRFILWNKQNIDDSLKDYLKRFNIKKIKHSAYASMKYGDKTSNKKSGDMKRWMQERWRNLTPLILNDKTFYVCGKQSDEQKKQNLPSVCRASIKINDKTPTPLSGDISMQKIKKAVNIKKKGERIKWNEL